MMQALRCFIVYPTLIPLLLDLIGAARLLKHVFSPVAKSDWEAGRWCGKGGIAGRHPNRVTPGGQWLCGPIEDPGARACVIAQATTVARIFRRDRISARRLC